MEFSSVKISQFWWIMMTMFNIKHDEHYCSTNAMSKPNQCGGRFDFKLGTVQA